MATAQSALDIPTLLATPIQFPLPESEVKLVLASAPFIPIPHALNLRTISSPNLQPNKVFRSGALSHLTPSILSALKDQYNITAIFDLRARNEREKQPSPDVEGIETIWIPNTEDAGTAPPPIYIPIEDFAVGGGVDAYLRRYENVLQMYGSVYKTIFEKLRDSDEGGVLFHCTAGKDRTGILAAFILALADADPEDIAYDYALTRIGTEPFREKLLAHLMAYMGMDPNTALDQPGMTEMCGTSGSTMVAFLKWMDGKWGEKGNGRYPGVEGYLSQELGFGKEDLEQIKNTLKG